MTRQDAITAAAKVHYELDTGKRWDDLSDSEQRARRAWLTPLIEAAAEILEEDGARRVRDSMPYPRRKDGKIVP